MKFNDSAESFDYECPGCGLPAPDWPHGENKGFLSPGGEFFCCKNCFEGRICDCGQAQERGENIRYRRQGEGYRGGAKGRVAE